MHNGPKLTQNQMCNESVLFLAGLAPVIAQNLTLALLSHTQQVHFALYKPSHHATINVACKVLLSFPKHKC